MFSRRTMAVGFPAAALSLTACTSGSVSGATAAPSSAAGTSSASSGKNPNIVADSQKIVDAAMGTGTGFTPPSGGPKAQKAGSTIAYVGADLTNGGINAVSLGVKEAADAIGWKVAILDGKGSVQGRTEALSQAIALNPAGIILGGFDAKEQASLIKQAGTAKIPVVAWHGGTTAGPMTDQGIFTNVTTDALVVSKLAAAFVVADSKGTAGVVLFTDRQYDIAVAKSDAMKAYIEQCEKCSVLEYENSPIAEADQRMPGLVSNLLQQYGSKLTYLMGINGNYFGGAAQALRAAKVSGDGPPKSVAAGDGDAAEFQRIRNHDYQAATVAEPTNLQGWQLIDELNRAIAGSPASGFVAQPGLITAANVPAQGTFDPTSGYRDIYKKNWTA